LSESLPLELLENARAHAARLRLAPAALEPAFLALGARLREYHGTSRRLSEHSREVSAELVSRPVELALERLDFVLSLAGCLLGQDEVALSALMAVGAEIAAVCLQTRTFESLIRQMHALARMIRIETAHQGEERRGTFATLAHEVESLVAEIEGRSQGLSLESERLGSRVARTVATAQRFKSARRNHLDLLVEDCAARLDALRERHAMALQAMDHIAQEWATISDGLSGVVTSLQSHDIVRQSVEHVAEVLEGLDPSLTPGQVRGICEIQAAQLRRASQEASASTVRLAAHLREIGEGVDGIRRHADLETVKCGDGTGVDECASGLARLALHFADLGDEYRRQTRTLEELKSPVRSMATYAGEISRLGSAMRILGLNAGVHAARAGDSGAALGVLAERIYELSESTATGTAQIAAHLQSAASSADGLTEIDLTSISGRGDELRSLASTLRSSSARAFDEMRAVSRDAAALLDDLGRLAVGLDLHSSLDAALVTVVAWLGETAARFGDAEAPSDGAGFRDDHYTMEAERRTHGDVLCHRPGHLPVEDDGVELF
jgi:methyl-accepting chemotaxis protein